MTRAPLLATSRDERLVWRDLRDLWEVTHHTLRNPLAALAALAEVEQLGRDTTVRLARSIA
jgi:hypothetical protein